MHLKLWVISNLLPQISTPYFSPIPEWIFTVLSGMEDPWKVFHPQSKHSPKLLPVSPYSKDKVGLGAPLTTQNGILGLKIVKINSLP